MKKNILFLILFLLGGMVGCSSKDTKGTVEPMELSQEGQMVADLYGGEGALSPSFFSLHFPSGDHVYELTLYQLNKGKISKVWKDMVKDDKRESPLGILIGKEEIHIHGSRKSDSFKVSLPLPDPNLLHYQSISWGTLSEKKTLDREQILFLLEARDGSNLNSHSYDSMEDDLEFGDNDGFFLTIAPKEEEISH